VEKGIKQREQTIGQILDLLSCQHRRKVKKIVPEITGFSTH